MSEREVGGRGGRERGRNRVAAEALFDELQLVRAGFLRWCDSLLLRFLDCLAVRRVFVVFLRERERERGNARPHVRI